MKKYVISAFTPNTPIDEKFLQTIRTFSIRNQAEIVLVETSPNYIGDLETEENMELVKSLKSHIKFGRQRLNDNLFLSEVKQSINIVDPITGLERMAANIGSLIVPFPRHRFKTIPRMLKDDRAPRGIWCTGTISQPNYKNCKAGLAMREYHVIGALIVEIEDDKKFHIRQLKWDGKGFYDLDAYYTQHGFSRGHRVSAIVLGDDHSTFLDMSVVEKTKQLFKRLRPKYVIHHDTLDSTSISHHLDNKKISKAQVNLMLEDEGRSTSNYLQSMLKASKDAQHILVASNHIEHLDKYLEEARYVNDTFNHILALELAWKKAMGFNVVEYLLRKFNQLERFRVASRKDSFKLHGIELLCHGDYGSSGAKGTPKDFDLVYNGKAITGHSHAPEIGIIGGFVVGTSTHLSLPYTNDSGGSKWLNSHVILYPNGKRTHIHFISED